MKKVLFGVVAVLLAVIMLASCDSTYGDTPTDIIIGAESTTTASKPDSDSGDDVSYHGIEVSDYPNKSAVSEYENLTEDQKIAFDVMCDALDDILKNGPTPYKSYPLTKRITWYDYKTAHNLFYANYTAAEDINTLLLYKDSLGTQDYVDSIYLYGYKAESLSEYYQRYLEVESACEDILSSLDHDGTEYGKAFAIARWLVENVVYPQDWQERAGDDLNTAYGALVNNEAVCDGLAKAYDFLCKKAGLETIYVTSSSTSADSTGHAWNMICIDENWYHVDTTWMEEHDLYSYFMMNDELCRKTGHEEWEYYRYQETNESINPVADSELFYKSKFDTVDRMLDFYKKQDTVVTSLPILAILPTEDSDKVIALDNSVVEIGGEKYFMWVSRQSEGIYNIYFGEYLIRAD